MSGQKSSVTPSVPWLTEKMDGAISTSGAVQPPYLPDRVGMYA